MSHNPKLHWVATHKQPAGAFSPFKNLKEVQKTSWFRFENKTDTAAGGKSIDVYIYDQIGGWFGTNAQDFVKELKDHGDLAAINLHLNTPGGEIFDGLTIYNTLVNHPATVNVIVDGLAASAGSFVAMAGDNVTMSKGSMMMIHDGSAFVYGPAKDMRETADILDKMSNSIASIYADHAGGTVDNWRGFMLAETWYTAEEAVTAKLADKVAGKVVEDPQNKWDLSIFNYAGRDKAPSPADIAKKLELNIKEPQVTNPAPVNTATTVSPPVITVPPVITMPASAAPTNTTSTESSSATFASAVYLNGVPVTDTVKIQAHIQSLEGFQSETRIQNRKDFVEKLAKDGKITAPQIGGDDGVEAFALSLPPEAYDKWVKTWNVAPVNPLFQSHAGGITNPEGDSAGPAAKLKDEIEINLGILKSLKDGNMKQEALEKTQAYQFLKANNALPV